MLAMMPPMPPRSHLVDDFGNRALGSLVGQGWSISGSTSSVNFTVESDAGSLSGRRVLVDKTGSDESRLICMDAAGSPASVEVLARIKFTETVTFENGQVNIRDVPSQAGGILCRVTGTGPSGSSNDNKLQLLYDDGGPSTIDQTNFTHSVDVWYWCRLRGIGTSFSAKIWADGNAEPAFQVSGTQVGAIAAGGVGMGCFENDDNYVFDFFSVGLGGAIAPSPAG